MINIILCTCAIIGAFAINPILGIIVLLILI